MLAVQNISLLAFFLSMQMDFFTDEISKIVVYILVLYYIVYINIHKIYCKVSFVNLHNPVRMVVFFSILYLQWLRMHFEFKSLYCM